MKPESHARELDGVSNLFISSKSAEEKKASSLTATENGDSRSDEEDHGYEVEESVIVQKKIAYPNTRKAQENIKKFLFKSLQEGFIIKSIELKKSADVLTPKRKKSKEENIFVVLKESEL